jgi:hypothetical protein
MQILTLSEQQQVSGAILGPIGLIAGNTILDAIRVENALFDTTILSIPGDLLSRIPFIGKPAHWLLDTSLGYGPDKALEAVGRAIGGVGPIDYNYFHPGEPGSPGYFSS